MDSKNRVARDHVYNCWSSRVISKFKQRNLQYLINFLWAFTSTKCRYKLSLKFKTFDWTRVESGRIVFSDHTRSSNFLHKSRPKLADELSWVYTCAESKLYIVIIHYFSSISLIIVFPMILYKMFLFFSWALLRIPLWNYIFSTTW